MREEGTKKKHLIYVGIGVVAVVGLIVGLTFGLSPKKPITNAEDKTPTVTLAQLNNKVTALENTISSLPKQKDWSSTITALDAEITKLKTSMTGISQDVEETLASFQPTTIPHYAIVNTIDEKKSATYISVSVFGAGDYPILLSIYGSDLQDATITRNPDNDCFLADKFSYGTFTLICEDATITIPAKTFTSSPADPAAHTHTVAVNGIEFVVQDIDDSFDATQVVVVVQPEDEWKAEDSFQIKVTGGDAEVNYASAVAGASWEKTTEGW